jgi:hypothetical protein
MAGTTGRSLSSRLMHFNDLFSILRSRSTTLAFLLTLLCFSGCGSSGSRRHSVVPTPSSYIAGAEHQCGVVYGSPRVIGEPLGFMCGKAANMTRFAVIYTRRLRCSLFATIVAGIGEDRMQGCLSSKIDSPAGTITCENDDTVAIAARTLPRARSATLLLSTGRRVTSKVFSLNETELDRWGGVYFNVLTLRTAVTALLVERDKAGHAFHRLLLVPIGRCPALKAR